MSDKITSIFYWIWIGILAILMFDAVTSPLIRWSWGFYNYEIFTVIGLIIITWIFRILINSISCLNELKELNDLIRGKNE